MVPLTKRWRVRASYNDDNRRATLINTFIFNTERNNDHE